MRYVCGDSELFQSCAAASPRSWSAGDGVHFVEAKLAERDERHTPHGRFALRHSSPTSRRARAACAICTRCSGSPSTSIASTTSPSWSERGVFTPREALRFEKASAFLWTVRCHLHYLAGRAEERLTFDLQPEVRRASRLPRPRRHPGVERFMKHYFLVGEERRRPDAHLLRRAGGAASAALAPAPARLPPVPARGRGLPRGRRTAVRRRGRSSSTKHPVDLLRALPVAQRRDGSRHPSDHALRLITQNLRLIDRELRADPEANRLFLEMLTSRKDPETDAAPPQRGRRVRPLRARFRPRRRADAARHVPPLHGRRAHDLRHRHPAPHRARAS